MPIIIFEGPDRVGKTTISEAVAEHYKIESFVSNSKNAFAKGIFGRDSSSISLFNSMLAQFVKALHDEDPSKPIILYRHFMSEIVYSKVLNRRTDITTNNLSDAIFESCDATIVLLNNNKTNDFKDDQLEDVKITEAKEAYNELKSIVFTDVLEIDTSDQDVESYVQQIVGYVEAKENKRRSKK